MFLLYINPIEKARGIGRACNHSPIAFYPVQSVGVLCPIGSVRCSENQHPLTNHHVICEGISFISGGYPACVRLFHFADAGEIGQIVEVFGNAGNLCGMIPFIPCHAPVIQIYFSVGIHVSCLHYECLRQI